MIFFERLLRQLGWVRAPDVRRYTLDDALRPVLDSLAEQQQSSPDEMASSLVNESLSRRQLDAELVQRWQSLSTREQDVAALACLGHTNRQIASILSISPETVKTHLRNALVKFNLHTRSELRMLLQDWDFSAWNPQNKAR
jgi:DNA-binding CsgD family transcriptional regulator